MAREKWSSRFIFILASIGAAAGLGNLWRFPYQVFDNGGGAFVIAYIVILFLFVIPLLLTEVAIGQKAQSEVVEVYDGLIKWPGKFLAWTMILMIFAMGGYYAVVVAWGVDFFAASFDLQWGNDAAGFFTKNILNSGENPLDFNSFSQPVIWGLVAVFGAMYFSLFKSLKSISAVVKWTATLPFLLLAILAVNLFWLDGATEGLRYFLIPQWERLLEIKVWSAAFSQAFFSIGVGFGVYILFAGFNEKKTKMFSSSVWIALGNFAVSLLAGVVIFGTMGWMAKTQGVAITELFTGGPPLTFIVFPTAVAQFPFFPNAFAVIFFGALLTLAIDSMFALIELVYATLKNQFHFCKKMRTEFGVGVLCLILFVWSLAFAGGNGAARIDAVDHFLFGHLLYFLLFFQIILWGWIFPIEKIRKFINSTTKFEIGIWFDYIIKYLAPAAILGIYIPTLADIYKKGFTQVPPELFWRWGIFPVFCIVGFGLLLSLNQKEKKKWYCFWQ